MYNIDKENNIRTEKSGEIDYIQNDIIYLLRVENDGKSHHIYMLNMLKGYLTYIIKAVIKIRSFALCVKVK